MTNSAILLSILMLLGITYYASQGSFGIVTLILIPFLLPNAIINLLHIEDALLGWSIALLVIATVTVGFAHLVTKFIESRDGALGEKRPGSIIFWTAFALLTLSTLVIIADFVYDWI